MGLLGGKRKLGSNSALAIAAGCAVAFMFIATIISTILYKQRMDEAVGLMAETTYNEYDSYVVMISSDDDSAFWKQVYESAKEYGKENGVYIDMISQSIDESYSKTELIEMAIESDCDAIFVEGDDSEETATMLHKAKKRGIPVFALSTDVDAESRISYIGPNSYSIASLYGTSLVDNLVKQKKVMVLGSNSVNESTANAFVNNIQTALSGADIANAPLEFEVRAIAESGPFATEEYIQNMFKENDLAPVVICLDEETTASFYQAMIDYNKVGSILLFGSDKSSTIMTGIKQGVIVSSVYVDSKALGEAAAAAFIEYKDAGNVSDYISVDAKLVDSGNIAEELQEVEDE